MSIFLPSFLVVVVAEEAGIGVEPIRYCVSVLHRDRWAPVKSCAACVVLHIVGEVFWLAI